MIKATTTVSSRDVPFWMCREWIIRGLLTLRFLDAFADELITAPMLFLFVENLQLNLVDSVDAGVFAIIPAAVVNIFLAPTVDSITRPWPLVVCSILSTLLRFLSWYGIVYQQSIIISVAVMTFLPAIERIIETYNLLALSRTNEFVTATIDPKRATYGRINYKKDFERITSYSYSLQHLGMFFGDIVYYIMRGHIEHIHDANAHTILLGISVTACSAFLSALLYLALDHVADRHELLKSPETLEHTQQNAIHRAWTTWTRLLNDKRFWKMVIICALLLGTWNIFRYIDIGVSIVLVRVHGERVPFPLIDAINPILTIFLSLIADRFFRPWRAYKVIILGTFVCAASILPVVIAPGSLFMYSLFLIFFTIGEVIWVPRFTALVMNVAPSNQQAAYMAAVHLPQFVGKIMVNFFSGRFIDHFCPGGVGPCHARPIWGLVFLVAFIPPIALLLARQWLEVGSPSDTTIASYCCFGGYGGGFSCCCCCHTQRSETSTRGDEERHSSKKETTTTMIDIREFGASRRRHKIRRACRRLFTCGL